MRRVTLVRDLSSTFQEPRPPVGSDTPARWWRPPYDAQEKEGGRDVPGVFTIRLPFDLVE